MTGTGNHPPAEQLKPACQRRERSRLASNVGRNDDLNLPRQAYVINANFDDYPFRRAVEFYGNHIIRIRQQNALRPFTEAFRKEHVL